MRMYPECCTEKGSKYKARQGRFIKNKTVFVIQKSSILTKACKVSLKFRDKDGPQ